MTRIQNLEYRIQNGTRDGGAHAVHALPGKTGRAVGKGEKAEAWKWEKAVQNLDFFPDNGAVSRLFPRLPGISHLFPHQFLLAKRSLEPMWGDLPSLGSYGGGGMI